MHQRVLFFCSMLGVAGVILLICAASSAFSDRLSEALDAGPQWLAYHTDHRAVLEACRQVVKDPQAAGFPPATNGHAMVDGSQNGTAPAALPAVLRDLKFEDMIVRGDEATITFGGGTGHWGFTTGQPLTERDPQWELIPGLWYWTEGGSFPRDLAKFPYYQTSKRMLAGGVVAIGLAVALAIRYRRRRPPLLKGLG